MGLSSSEQRKLAYFHSLDKTMTESQQNIYESNYKSSHNIRINEIWSDDLPFANTYADAKNYTFSYTSITIHEKVFLSEVYGSNGQSYVYIQNGKFKDNSYPLSERGDLVKRNPLSNVEPKYIRPFVSPEDVMDITLNKPSFGYTLRLFKEDNTEIYLTEGNWVVKYNNGMVYFAEGYTPYDMGWGNIKASFFEYSGNLLTNTLYDMNKDNISGVTFLNDTLYFNQQDGDVIEIDLSSLTIMSRISHDNNNMIAENTSHINRIACSTPLLTSNISGSSVVVFVNGVQVNLGDDDNCDCYFSNDNGVTKKPLDNIIVSDYLYWNYDINNVPISGYELSNIDKLTFMYLT